MSRRFSVTALVVGMVALALTALGALVDGDDVGFRSYLMGYTFWLGLGLGSLGVLLVQYLTGGVWGLATRRVFEAGAATLPLLAVLFVPVAFGISRLYVWARPEVVASDPVLQHKALYLNVPFFLGRSVVYLAVWMALALVLRRWSAAHDRTGDRRLFMRLQRVSIVGAPVLGLTATFAAIDWLMSLDADWYSTMYPPMVAMSDLLVALAFGIVVVALLAPSTSLRELMTPGVYNDLGSLLLAFLLLWAYLAYFQYLLIWAGNLSEEIPWYLRRVEGGWLPVAVVIAGLGFALPFWLLLFRPLKRDRRTLAPIAGLLVCLHVADVYWLVEPPLEPGGPLLSWLDAGALVGIGGVWLAVFAWQLAARPLLPRYDPRLERALEAARETA